MNKIVFAAIVFSVLVFTACNSNSTSKDTNATTQPADASKKMEATKYTCTMHPEVISDKPGKCPKCGMDLTPVKDSSMQNMNMDTMKH